MYISHMARRKSSFGFRLAHVKVQASLFGEVLKVGVPTLVFQLLTSVAIGLTNRAAGSYGDEAVAAMGIATRLFTLGSFVVFGFMKGFQPFIGFNYGAHAYTRVKEAVRVSILGSTVLCAAISAALFALPEPIMRLFSATSDTVVSIGSRALRAEALPFVLFGLQMLVGSAFLALGKGLIGGIMNIARQGLFFLPLMLFLPRAIGLQGVILAQPIADAASAILAGIFALRLTRELR